MPAAVEIAVRGTALVYALAEGVTVTVGRIGQCEIHIEDQAVSRRHCTLTLQGASVLVNDLSSANGTFLNDVEVQSAAAAPGDVIRVGSTALELRDPAAAVPSAAGTAGVATEADKGIESVIRRRIDPADVEWLSSGTSVMPALELLQRA